MTANFLHKEFLDSDEHYYAAQEAWIAGLKRVTPPTLWGGYKPYVSETFANGQAHRDGNPIISAMHLPRRRAVRIVMLDPQHFGVHYETSTSDARLVKYGKTYILSEKLIMLTMTERSFENALAELAEWLFGIQDSKRRPS